MNVPCLRVTYRVSFQNAHTHTDPITDKDTHNNTIQVTIRYPHHTDPYQITIPVSYSSDRAFSNGKVKKVKRWKVQSERMAAAGGAKKYHP